MFTCFGKAAFRECGKANAYSANIEYNVSAHGEQIRERKAPTENSNSPLALVLYESTIIVTDLTSVATSFELRHRLHSQGSTKVLS
jgi:hypothetical protein